MSGSLTSTPTATARWNRLGQADAWTIACLCLSWVGLTRAAGFVGAGYHLADDHEILRIVADLRHGSYLDVLRRWTISDLNLRFRPFYFVHRVAEALLFGDDLRAWGVYTAALGAITAVLLYLALRSLRFPPPASVALVLLVVVGPQASIWWRLGPNETIGMACLALAGLGLARWSLTGARGWRLAFWAGTALASLSKESFVALLPALAFATLWSVVWQRNCSWRAAILGCLPEILLVSVLLVAESWVIVFVVGTDQIGYAGVKGVTPRMVLAAGVQLLGWPEALTLAALGALAGLAGWRGRGTPLRSLAPALVLGALLIGGQAFLYAKPGAVEHYLLPGRLAAALLCAMLMNAVISTSRAAPGEEPVAPPGGRSFRGAARRIIAVSACLVVVPVVWQRSVQMARDVKRFTGEGRATQAFLDAVAGVAPGANLVVAGGVPGISEQFWSIRWYLRVRAGRERVGFYFVQPATPLNPFQLQLLDSFRNDRFFAQIHPGDGGAAPDVLAMLPGVEEQLLRQRPSWLDPAAFRRQEMPGGFALYTATAIR